MNQQAFTPSGLQAHATACNRADAIPSHPILHAFTRTCARLPTTNGMSHIGHPFGHRRLVPAAPVESDLGSGNSSILAVRFWIESGRKARHPRPTP